MMRHRGLGKDSSMQRLRAIKAMLRQRRIGFMMDEVMTGSHHFVNGAGPEGEHDFSFRVTWGTRHLEDWLNPFGAGFMSNFLQGTVKVGGLVDEAPCQGTLDLRYFQEGSIRYTFDFKDQGGRPLRYLGEKVNIRPWNLHHSHTTCFGTITDLRSGQDVSKSIVYFKFNTLPAFLGSVRLG